MQTEPLNMNITKEHKRKLQRLRGTMTLVVERLIDAEFERAFPKGDDDGQKKAQA